MYNYCLYCIEDFKHSLNISAVNHVIMGFVIGMLNINYMDTFAVFCYKSYFIVSRSLVTITEDEKIWAATNSIFHSAMWKLQIVFKCLNLIQKFTTFKSKKTTLTLI